MKKNIKLFISSLMGTILATPAFLALASVTTFSQLVNETLIGGILKPLVPFLVGLAVVVFLYGVIILMFSEGGEKKEEGKQYMMWGIVGIFVMVSVWGIVAILTNTFNLDTSQTHSIQMTAPKI
jgi:hypothetical protein